MMQACWTGGDKLFDLGIHTWPEHTFSSQLLCFLNTLVGLVEFLQCVDAKVRWNQDILCFEDEVVLSSKLSLYG